MLYTKIRRVHENTLGNLDSQQSRADLRNAHRALHHLDNGPLLELFSGNVDCDGYRPRSSALPLADLPATFPDDKVADVTDLACPFGDRDELHWGYAATNGMKPADERL